MKQAIQVMTREILRILDGQEPSLYLFDSVTMGDFHLGWSDIDFLCLTRQPISPSQREELVPLGILSQCELRCYIAAWKPSRRRKTGLIFSSGVALSIHKQRQLEYFDTARIVL